MDNFNPDNAVQIRWPAAKPTSFGSGYRIGGRLVLTAKHLFKEIQENQCCRVRLSDAAEDTEAKVVWCAAEIDIALVELSEPYIDCEPVRLGQLPYGTTVEEMEFLAYGWPNIGRTKRDNGKSAAGRRQIPGFILLGDTSADQNIVLRVDARKFGIVNRPSSAWEGASGSAIGCNGYLVGVQSQCPNPDAPMALEAAPLVRLENDDVWKQWLEKYGIDPQVHIISLQGASNIGHIQNQTVSLQLGSDEQRMAKALWNLNYQEQQNTFGNWFSSDRVAGAFAIEVNYDLEADLQKCLVSRLSRFLVGGQVPVFGTLGVSREWRNDPLSQFILALAPSLDLPTTASISEVHDRLLDLCLTRSTIIALYDTPDMGKEALKELLEKFWHPLLNRLQQLSGSTYQERILLFLAGSRPMSLLKDNAGEPFSLEYPDCLENITTLDIGNWRRIPEVSQLINRRSSVIPDLRQALQQMGSRESEPSQILEANAYDAIEKIVDVFGFKGGLEDLEGYWQLSGDLAA